MERKKVKITTEFIKLDQLLKLSGVTGTGGQGKILINQGSVAMNGEVCRERGKKVRKGDIIAVDGMEIEVI